MPIQGRFGAAAGAAGVAGAGVAGFAAAALFVTFCDGADGAAASRCVTLLDCRPIDLPPPRRAASACTLTSAMAQTSKTDPILLMTSPLSLPINGCLFNT